MTIFILLTLILFILIVQGVYVVAKCDVKHEVEARMITWFFGGLLLVGIGLIVVGLVYGKN